MHPDQGRQASFNHALQQRICQNDQIEKKRLPSEAYRVRETHAASVRIACEAFIWCFPSNEWLTLASRILFGNATDKNMSSKLLRHLSTGTIGANMTMIVYPFPQDGEAHAARVRTLIADSCAGPRLPLQRTNELLMKFCVEQCRNGWKSIVVLSRIGSALTRSIR